MRFTQERKVQLVTDLMAQHPGPSVPALQSMFVRPPSNLRQPQAPRRAAMPNQSRSAHVSAGERANDFSSPRSEFTAEETDALLEAWCSSQGSPLITAVKAGHEKLMKMLLQNGADINVSDDDGCTALHLACAAGRRNIVKVLLFTGADVDVINHYGETPLDLVTDEKIEALFARHKERVKLLPDDGFEWLSPPISPSDALDRPDNPRSGHSNVWNAVESPTQFPRWAKDVDASVSSNDSSDTIEERPEISFVDAAIEAARADGLDDPDLAMYIDDYRFEGNSSSRLSDWPVRENSVDDISFGWVKEGPQGHEADAAVGGGRGGEEGVNLSNRRWSGDEKIGISSGSQIGRDHHGSISNREMYSNNRETFSNNGVEDDEFYAGGFTWHQSASLGRVDGDITNRSPGGRQVNNWKNLSSGLSQRRVGPDDTGESDDHMRMYSKIPSPPVSDVSIGQRPIMSNGSPKSQRSGGSPDESPRDKMRGEEQGYGHTSNNRSPHRQHPSGESMRSRGGGGGGGGREKWPERQGLSRTVSVSSSEAHNHSQGQHSRRVNEGNELGKGERMDPPLPLPLPPLQRQPSMEHWALSGSETDGSEVDVKSIDRGWSAMGVNTQSRERKGVVLSERKGGGVSGELRPVAPGSSGIPRGNFDRISSAGRREGVGGREGGGGIMGLATHGTRRSGLLRSTSTDLGLAKFNLETDEKNLQTRWDTPLSSHRLRPVPPGEREERGGGGGERSHISNSALKGSGGPPWEAKSSWDGGRESREGRDGRDGRDDGSDGSGGGGGLLSPTPPANASSNGSANRPLLSPRVANLTSRNPSEPNRRPVTPPSLQPPKPVLSPPPPLDVTPSLTPSLTPTRPKTSPTSSPAPLLPSAVKRSSPAPGGVGKTEVGGRSGNVEKVKERKVKFSLPTPPSDNIPSENTVSDSDLASIRPDWREAAKVGACVACGKEGCQGECISNKGKKKVMPEVAKNLFSNAEAKTTGTLKWTRGELLGEGAYGKVFAGLNQSTGELMAVKQLKLADGDDKGQHMAALEREISLYRKMRHKHIVGYIDMERDEETGSLYVFLEFVSGGSIHSMLERFGKFSEPLVRIYTRQLLLGLEYLHSCKIIHRDIKGGNVLVDADGVIKLADFGASKAFHDATLTDGCKSIRGSVFWMAPEVIKGDGYGRRADIWSVGCTVIEMLTGSHPWPGMDNTWTAIFHIAKTTTGPPMPPDCSEEGKDFLSQCFQLDAKERPSATELLSHPFVVSVPDTPKEARLLGQQQQQ